MKVSITTAARCLALTAVLAGCSGDDDASDDQPAVTAPEGGPLSGIETYRGLSHSHVEGEVDYPVEPPVGGRHDQAWVNCGFFPEPVDPEQAVHSMEHGAVWITYRPDLPAPQVDTLRDLVADHPYLLVSPWPGELPSPVVLSAWGVQLEVNSATAPGVAAFVDEFEEASQAPEPGAPCVGGVGEPAATARKPS